MAFICDIAFFFLSDVQMSSWMVVRWIRVILVTEFLFFRFYRKNGLMMTNLLFSCVSRQGSERLSVEEKSRMFSYSNFHYRDFVRALQAYAVLYSHYCFQPDISSAHALLPVLTIWQNQFYKGQVYYTAHRAHLKASLLNATDFMVSCVIAGQE